MGRHCEFDEAEALDRAMVVFWKKGFEAASLDDLVQATGVGRQSLYNKFGDKRALFLRCLRRYKAGFEATVREHLARERPVARAFASLFERFLREPDAQKRMGCLMVNTAMELARTDVEVGDVIAGSQRALEAAFVEALEAGRARGDLPRDLRCEPMARFLLGTLLGMTVLQKSDPRSPAAADLVEVALQTLAR